MRIIAHIDMDAFFASVEEHANPHLRGTPLVIGADPENGRGRGVVSTASYAARAYGIHSAQPISQAWHLSEEAARRGKPCVVFLPVDMELYADVSRRIMNVLRESVGCVEEASIDEAYLDMSSLKDFGDTEACITGIKRSITKEHGITASVGIGPNKLIAKIASGRNKPDGFTVISREDVATFLEALSVREIPGVGPKTENVLNHKMIFTVRELKKIECEVLVQWFGKWGSALYAKARGIDDDPVATVRELSSIG